MAIPIKTPAEIQSMRKGGQILAATLEECIKRAKAGVSTYELDQFAEEFIRSKGGIPAFKGYNGFPGTLCTAINEVIVHGIPKSTEILKEGDLFTIDCGVILDGLYTDAARTITIGTPSPEAARLLEIAHLALEAGINAAKPGNYTNDIGAAIENIVRKAGYHIIRDLTGHGIGKTLHEEPIVLNYKDRDRGPILKPGMTIAIEPIFAAGTDKMTTLNDDWTIVTKDGSLAIQIENTVLITESGSEILTKIG